MSFVLGYLGSVLLAWPVVAYRVYQDHGQSRIADPELLLALILGGALALIWPALVFGWVVTRVSPAKR